jgi:hypothetical protein
MDIDVSAHAGGQIFKRDLLGRDRRHASGEWALMMRAIK